MNAILWKALLISSLCLSSTSTGTSSSTYSDISELKGPVEITVLNEELEFYKQENECLSMEFLDYKLSQKGLKFYKENIHMKKSVKPNFRKSFKDAWDTYTGPLIIWTSGNDGKHCTNSKHYHGLAADVRWRDGGEEFLEWLDSPSGKSWLEFYNLDFYIENVSRLRSHPNYVYNKHATGPHFHVYQKTH